MGVAVHGYGVWGYGYGVVDIGWVWVKMMNLGVAIIDNEVEATAVGVKRDGHVNLKVVDVQFARAHPTNIA